MAEYVNISYEDMKSFLEPQGFSEILIPKTAEAVWAKRVHQGNYQLSLRVFTGIVHAASREVGEDAIRVCLFVRNEKGKISLVSGSKRVHRVKGWRENLQNRLDTWLELFPNEACPKCNNLMVPRSGKNGTFLGCSDYPTCTFTKTPKK